MNDWPGITGVAGGGLGGTYPNPTLVKPTKTLLSYNNSWEAYNSGNPAFGPAGHWTDNLGFVTLAGLLTKSDGGGSFVNGEAMFTLPAGSRPPFNCLFNIRVASGGGFTESVELCTVASSGAVNYGGAALGTVGWVSLAGLRFPVA